MRAAVRDRKDVHVGSAGVAAMPGHRVSSDTRAVLKAKNAPLKGFKSRQVDQALLADASLIVAMTGSHAAMVKRYFPGCARRVRLLCDFIHQDEGLAGADVPDPIGMGREAYEEVAEVIDLAIPGIIKALDK